MNDEMKAACENAGLYEPDSKTAADRLELLDILLQHGVGIDDMVAAEAEGTLALMLAPRASSMSPVPQRLPSRR